MGPGNTKRREGARRAWFPPRPRQAKRRAMPAQRRREPPAEAFSLGVDENGLGPRLGPLVVTSILARTQNGGNAVANARPKGALRKRLDDSKRLVSYDDSALGEAWARAV